MLGILYDNGEVCLAGDKSNLTKEETFTILKSFANLFKKTINLISNVSPKNNAAKKFEEGMKDIYITSFLAAASNEYKLYYDALSSLKMHISDDKFVFKIEDNWYMSIIVKPSSLSSLLNMIIYCMIMMSTDICEDPIYLLKYIDIVNIM